MKKRNKKAALELSMGTIVVLVLSVSMLILGIILIRSIMCSGIEITEELSRGVKNEVKTLFGADRYGVRCAGQGTAEIRLATGGQRRLLCFIRTDTPATYDLDVNIISLEGASTAVVNRWVISEGRKDIKVSPGGEGAEPIFAVLNIPADAQATTLEIEITAKNQETGSVESIFSIIDIEPTGAFRRTIC